MHSLTLECRTSPAVLNSLLRLRGGSAKRLVPSTSQQPTLTDEMSACSSAEKPALLSHRVAQPVDSNLLAEVRKLGQYSRRNVQITVESLVSGEMNLWTAMDTTNTTDQFLLAAVAIHRIH